MRRHHRGTDVRRVVRLTGLFAAIQFLTRIPIRLRREPDLAASVPWFPIVGVLIGGAVGGIAAGLVARGPATRCCCRRSGDRSVDHRRVSRGRARGRGRRIRWRLDDRTSTGDPQGLSAWKLRGGGAVQFDRRSGSEPRLTARSGGDVRGRRCRSRHRSCRGGGVDGGLATRNPPGSRRRLRPGSDTEADDRRHPRWNRVRRGGSWMVGSAVGCVLRSCRSVAVRWLAMRKIGGISGDVLGACEQVAECLCLVTLTGLATRSPTLVAVTAALRSSPIHGCGGCPPPCRHRPSQS